MGMQIGSGGGSADPEVMIEMNMTPLIDVMLVLIIMLIITIPIQNHAVNLNMPQGPSNPPPTEPVVVNIDVDFDGTVSWNGVAVNPQELDVKLAAAAAQPDQPEIHLRPVAVVPYKSVAAVMAAAQRLNVTKIGMVGNEQFLK
ncbi:ExbD/TolR family protein [Undibacterium pigrum]|uniref:Outer membrane transport energization protein ExbD n=1 Tax=Undibacterium pigrum TaxID=401470 RepID=A0A318ILZ2_9BURK|nr:biopolymer transporter ExbD [Undibacterium pigrum]PXX35222.1 outer membrane transport energization protein ExbD [Undibacterium pigrum]